MLSETMEGFDVRQAGSDQKDLSQALGAIAAAATTITGVTFEVAHFLSNCM